MRRISLSVPTAAVAAVASIFSACVHVSPDRPCSEADWAAGDFEAADLTPLRSFRRLSAPPITLVTNALSVPIVAADDAASVAAAFELADVIHRRTGARAEIRRLPAGVPPPPGPAFFIGDAAAGPQASCPPHAPPDMFRVVVSGTGVRFGGRADLGVVDWCERQLGVRCFGPEEADFRVPRAAVLSASAVDYSDAPVFAHRDFGAYGQRRWGRYGKTGRAPGVTVRAHVPAAWHRERALLAAHPEIFARARDGGRGGTPLLCYGHPATLAIYQSRIDGQIAGRLAPDGIVDTKTKTIYVSPWDMFVDCTCDICRPLLEPAAGAEGYASRVVWGHFLPRLARWAAQKHPDYRLSFLPYWNTCAVPAGLDLRAQGNCRAVYCVMPGLALLKDKPVRLAEEARIRAWRRATGQRPLLWHYSCWPAEYTCAPYLYGETIRRHFRAMRDEIDGAFVCGGHDLPRHTLSLYVWMRCLWNPQLDVAAVYDAYAERLFGRAAEPVREILRRLERGWSRPWPDSRLSDENVFGRSYPPDAVRALRRLLDEAHARAAGEPAVRARLRALEADWAPFFRRAETVATGRARPLIDVRRVAARPVVDGRLDEACWHRAEARAFVGALSGRAPWAGTSVRAVWSAEGVTFAWRCDEPAAAHLRRDAAQGDFLRQDTLSVVLDTTGTTRGACRHLMLDAANRLSVFVDSVPAEWDGAQSAVWIGADFWSAELYLPFAALPACEQPQPGMIWSGNMVRGRLGDTWRPPPERLPGSRAETSRLWTAFSPLNTDRDAFLPFCFSLL